MKGTSDEVLEWITYHHEYAPLLQMSRQRLVGLRWRLHEGSVSEVAKDEILEKLKKRMDSLKSMDIRTGCCSRSIQKVRNRYVLPAVVRDHKGKFFCETTMVMMVAREHKMRDLNLDKVCGAIKRGDLPSKEVVREVLRRKGWNMFEERMVLPSVWEVV